MNAWLVGIGEETTTKLSFMYAATRLHAIVQPLFLAPASPETRDVKTEHF